MKNVLIVLALGSLLLTPIEAAQSQPSNICIGKETKPVPRKTFKHFLSWLGLGIGSTFVASILINNNRGSRLEAGLANMQLADVDRQLQQLPSEEALRGTNDATRNHFNARAQALEADRQKANDRLKRIQPTLLLNKAALTSAYIAIVASLFKAYRNFPNEQVQPAIKRLRDSIRSAATKSLHLGKAMGYGLSGLGMGIASAGITGLGGYQATQLLQDNYHGVLPYCPQRDSQKALCGVATALITWHYLLPITWNLSKKHWQTAKEEWSKFRHPEQNNAQPSALVSTPAAA